LAAPALAQDSAYPQEGINNATLATKDVMDMYTDLTGASLKVHTDSQAFGNL